MGRLTWSGIPTVGVGVAHSAVRAVVVRSGRAVWATEIPRGEDESLTALIGRLVAAAPLARWTRPSVVVALGPSMVQTKHLVKLPSLTDPQILTRVVAEGAERFFLRNGVPLATTGVRPGAKGEGWASAAEQPVLREVTDACHAARLRLRAMVPTVTALGFALRAENALWTDGSVVADVSFAHSRLIAIRRCATPSGIPKNGELTTVAGLDVLAADAWRFADAYGAAVLPRGEKMVFRPAGSTSREGTPRWRLLTAGSAAALAAATVLLAPGIAATHSARAASARLTAIAVQRRAATLVEDDLARTTALLAELADFDRTRRAVTFLLADLARGIPAEAALVALRVDSTGGSLVALSPRAGEVLASLERVPGVASPEIFGPVTREAVGGREFERATIRFQFARPTRESSSHDRKGVRH